MFSLGFGEIMLLAFIALVVIGPEQLPEVAKSIARLINEWKRASSDLTGTLTKDIREDIVNHINDRRESAATETPVESGPVHQDYPHDVPVFEDEIELPKPNPQAQQLEFSFSEGEKDSENALKNTLESKEKPKNES